jgi:uncharacterized protein YjiS (DUF1127 family)
MKTMSAIIKSTGRFFEATSRARVQSTLLTMGRDWVEHHGYSWELLRAGVSEWPWRQSPETVVAEQEINRAIAELNSYSDRELHDLRISRCGIENAVRYGRCENDFAQVPQKSAA